MSESRLPGTVHHAAQDGYSTAADTYRTGRPDYPAEAGEWLRDTLALGPGRDALDLGAGTGKFTPLLLATGARVLALEPVAAMRAELANACPAVTLVDGSAEAIALPDGAVDAVVCAQSFHWFATRAALGEIHRVLRPGGVLGLIWNVRDYDTPWVAELTDIVDAYEADAPRHRTGDWRKVFPADGFEPLAERHAIQHHVGPAERVIVGRVLSTSFIAALPREEQDKVAARVRDVIARTPDLSGRADVAYPYRTEMFAFRKIAA